MDERGAEECNEGGGNVGWEYDEEEDKIFRESKAACAEKGKGKGFFLISQKVSAWRNINRKRDEDEGGDIQEGEIV